MGSLVHGLRRRSFDNKQDDAVLCSVGLSWLDVDVHALVYCMLVGVLSSENTVEEDMKVDLPSKLVALSNRS